jgi:hypothetical protein
LSALLLETYEHCLAGLTFPFLSVSPWQLRGTQKMYAVGWQLQSLHGKPDLDSGEILCKLCKLAKGLQSLRVNVVRKLLCFS